MTEQEKFYKTLNELLNYIFVGFAIGVVVFIGLMIWAIL